MSLKQPVAEDRLRASTERFVLKGPLLSQEGTTVKIFEPRGDNFRDFKKSDLKAKARIWP